MTPPEKSPLDLIEKVSLVIYTALALGSVFFWNFKIFFGILAGGAFAWVNFRGLRFIVGRVFLDPEKPRPGYFALLLPKFTLIGLFLWLCIKYEAFNIVAFVVGTTGLFLAITGVSLFRRPEPVPFGNPAQERKTASENTDSTD